MDILAIKTELANLSEPAYADFTRKLVPNAVDPILGVRMPALRKLAKQLAKEDWQGFIKIADGSSHEMNLLQAYVLGNAKTDLQTLLPYLDSFVSTINNWAVCDSLVSSLKMAGKYQEELWSYLQSCLKSADTYRIRFAVVMMMSYYREAAYAEQILALFDAVQHDEYYVKMAVAWAISMFYVHLPELTLPYLQNNNLDKFTFNKTLQKIRESRIPSTADKEMIGAMRRK